MCGQIDIKNCILQEYYFFVTIRKMSCGQNLKLASPKCTSYTIPPVSICQVYLSVVQTSAALFKIVGGFVRK